MLSGPCDCIPVVPDIYGQLYDLSDLYDTLSDSCDFCDIFCDMCDVYDGSCDLYDFCGSCDFCRLTGSSLFASE